MWLEGLLLSIKPRYADRIVAGTKTVELRRVRPLVATGSDVLIYSSSPTMALVAIASIGMIEEEAPHTLWRQVRDNAGIERAAYRDYFGGVERGVAISLNDVRTVPPVALKELRRLWPGFQPPQSHRFVTAQLDSRGRLIAFGPRPD